MADDVKIEYLRGCPVEIWDGPYQMRCKLGAAVNQCAHHGPFTPARRCRLDAACWRPEGHGGTCWPREAGSDGAALGEEDNHG